MGEHAGNHLGGRKMNKQKKYLVAILMALVVILMPLNALAAFGPNDYITNISYDITDYQPTLSLTNTTDADSNIWVLLISVEDVVDLNGVSLESYGDELNPGYLAAPNGNLYAIKPIAVGYARLGPFATGELTWQIYAGGDVDEALPGPEVSTTTLPATATGEYCMFIHLPAGGTQKIMHDTFNIENGNIVNEITTAELDKDTAVYGDAAPVITVKHAGNAVPGTPYTYEWTKDGNPVDGNLPVDVGEYTLTITMNDTSTYNHPDPLNYTITKKVVTPVLKNAATDFGKVYDGTTDVTLSNQASLFDLSGLISSDQNDSAKVALNIALKFASADVNAHPTINTVAINVDSASLSGTKAANYNLVTSPLTLSGEITPKSLTINWPTFSYAEMNYLGQSDLSIPAANVTSSAPTVSGFVDLSASGGRKDSGTLAVTYTRANPDVGANVAVNGSVVLNMDAGSSINNYTLSNTTPPLGYGSIKVNQIAPVSYVYPTVANPIPYNTKLNMISLTGSTKAKGIGIEEVIGVYSWPDGNVTVDISGQYDIRFTPQGSGISANYKAADSKIQLNRATYGTAITAATPLKVTYGYTGTPFVTVSVKNNGNITQNISLVFEGAAGNFTMDSSTPISVGANQTGTFKVNLASSLDVNTYTAKVKAVGEDGTTSAEYTISAEVEPASVRANLIASALPITKTYDSTTDVKVGATALSSAHFELNSADIVDSDTLYFVLDSSRYAQANASSSDIAITATGHLSSTAGGTADITNYTLSMPTNIEGKITPAELSINWGSAPSFDEMSYLGQADDSIAADKLLSGGPTASGLFGGDAAIFSVTYTRDNPNVGDDVPVNAEIKSFSTTVGSVSNYKLPASSSLSNDSYGTIKVNKIKPTLVPAKFTSQVPPNQLLANLNLSGSKANGLAGDGEVDGTWAWTDTKTNVDVSGNYQVTFTPNPSPGIGDDVTQNYESQTALIYLTVAGQSSYSINIKPDIDEGTFDDITYGYSSAPYILLQVENGGDQDNQEITLALSGVDADKFSITDADDAAISGNKITLNKNQSQEIKVYLDEDLPVKDAYAATLSATSAANPTGDSVDFSAKVVKRKVTIGKAIGVTFTKPYDGETTVMAIVNSVSEPAAAEHFVLNNVLTADVDDIELSINVAYADKDAASQKDFVLNSASIADIGAADKVKNYELNTNNFNLKGAITKAPLKLVSAATKVYDGKTAMSLAELSNKSIDGVKDETFTVNAISATYASANVHTDQMASVTSVGITPNNILHKAANYSVTGEIEGSISRKPLNLSPKTPKPEFDLGQTPTLDDLLDNSDFVTGDSWQGTGGILPADISQIVTIWEYKSGDGSDIAVPFAQDGEYTFNLKLDKTAFENAVQNYQLVNDSISSAAIGIRQADDDPPDEDDDKPISRNVKHTVTYDAGEHGQLAEKADDKEKVKDGDFVTEVPQVIVDEGYVFSGWSRDDGDTIEDPKKISIRKNTKFVAQYQQDGKHMPYMIGRNPGLFVPEGMLSRAETVTMLSRLTIGFSEDASHDNSFNDVPSDQWYHKYIGFGSLKGYVNGYTDGSFQPDSPITRAEFAAVLCRFANVSEVSVANDYFVDIADSWARGYINAMATKGWADGYADQTFLPEQNISRAEATKMVNNAIGRVPDKEEAIRSYNNPFTDISPDDWYFYHVMEAANEHDISDYHLPK